MVNFVAMFLFFIFLASKQILPELCLGHIGFIVVYSIINKVIFDKKKAANPSAAIEFLYVSEDDTYRALKTKQKTYGTYIGKTLMVYQLVVLVLAFEQLLNI